MGDILLTGEINNYGGRTWINNDFGNIYATSKGLVKARSITLYSKGDIGTQANRVEVELQKKDGTGVSLNPDIVSYSSGALIWV